MVLFFNGQIRKRGDGEFVADFIGAGHGKLGKHGGKSDAEKIGQGG